jgi:ubiquinone/menaquinone biosynthesis C-methylase UbiE
MRTASDAHFWDRTSRKYAKSAIGDLPGYERTLERTRAALRPDHRVLELGCGTGTTALRLAPSVQSYLATDISTGMVDVAEEKLAADPVPALSFRAATSETLAREDARFDAILGFNYLHLVRDVPGTLRAIHGLLAAGGQFVSKTPCIGAMNPLIRLAIPAMRAIGKAPYVSVFTAAQLTQHIQDAGFDILMTENHASRGKNIRPYIVARKR